MNLENTKIVSIDKIISPKELKTLLSPNEVTINNIIKLPRSTTNGFPSYPAQTGNEIARRL